MRKVGLASVALVGLLLGATPAGVAAEDPYATAPETVIDTGPPAVARNARPTFTFSSPDFLATFECALTGSDQAGFAPCSSPFTTSPLSQGTYTFRVRAVSIDDVADPTPAEQTFDIDRNLSGANANAQRVQVVKGKRVSLVVSVKAAEPVRAFASGKVRLNKRRSYSFRSREAAIGPGVSRRLILAPEKAKANRRITKLLKQDREVNAVLTATFTDAVGNRATTGEIDVELRR